MKVIFEFNIDKNKDDVLDLELANNRLKMWKVISDLAQQTREWQKYDQRTEIPAQEIRDFLLNALASEGLRLEDFQ